MPAIGAPGRKNSEVQKVNEADPRNRRRSQSEPLQFAVVPAAELPGGNRVRVQAFTRAVNAHGRLLDAPLRMSASQRAKLVNPQSGDEVRCRVVRVDVPSDGSFRTPCEFDECNPDSGPPAILS